MTAVDLHLLEIGSVIAAGAACVCDLRTRRIPNALTFGSALAAVIVHLALQGPLGITESLGGWAVGLFLFLPFYLLRGMGAGDVKLLAALGAWLGPDAVCWAALYTGIAGGLLAIIVTLYHGQLRQTLTNVFWALIHWRIAGPSVVPNLTLASSNGVRLPYALPIFIGMVAALWLR